MKKERINNVNLRRLIALKCGKIDFEDVSDEEIEKISEITILGKKLNGEPTGITLDCLKLMNNIADLKLSDFILTPEDMDVLKQLEKLRSLQLSSCNLEEITEMSLPHGVSDFRITNCGKIKFKKYPEVSSIDISGSEIDMNSIDLDKVLDITILDSRIKNAKELTKFPAIRSVTIDGSILINKEGTIVDDIEVGENTVYTHLAQLETYDSRLLDREV